MTKNILFTKNNYIILIKKQYQHYLNMCDWVINFSNPISLFYLYHNQRCCWEFF